MNRRRVQVIKHHLKLAGYGRWSRSLVALVFMASLAIPTFSWLNDMKAYAISSEAERVMGTANKNLSAKFSFDQSNNRWQFNKNGAAALADNIAKKQGNQDADGVAAALSQLTAKQVGGSGEKDLSLYSANLPVKAKEGITYYDNVTRLSFTMVPSFSARSGKLVQDRIVYPFMDGAQIVYTAKSNGLKEDIVLSKYISETVRYSYNLQLPDTLQAKLLEDGSVGIYSANPSLFGNISFSSDDDKARVMEARKTSSKDNLVFSIPAPFIKDQTGNAGHTRYYLNGSRLTVVADGLKNLKYPLTVDPSVTITSTTDFQYGNDEGMVSFDTANQISRSSVTGGAVGPWHFTDNSTDRGTSQGAGSGSASGMITSRSNGATVTYNGYIYSIGGANTSSTFTNLVERAPLNSNGTLGTWVADTALPQNMRTSAVAYNGYMYTVGGASTSNKLTDVYYAAINSSTGALGSWTATTALGTARAADSGVAVYNNMLYVINGCTTGSGPCDGLTQPTTSVLCAALNGNGTVGTWNNSCGTTNLTARYGGSAAAYNGYVYYAGGCAHYNLGLCDSNPLTVQFAKINSSGTLDSWATSTTSFTTGRDFNTLLAYKGYLYLTNSGTSNSTVQFAPINANGDIGTWATTSNTNTANKILFGFQAYGNYLYIVGGCPTANCTSGGTTNAVEFSSIDSAGSVGSSNSATDFDASVGRNEPMVAAAFGYLYVLGGNSGGSSTLNTVKFAPINANGSVGTWNTTNAFSEARQAATVVVNNGFLYLIGGHSVSGSTNCTRPGGVGGFYCNNIEWASINPSTGALTWQGSTYTYSSTGRNRLGSAVNNGYIYVLGGIYTNNTNESQEVDYAQINANGTLGSFSQTTTQMTNGHGGPMTAAAHNGRIYALGSRNSKVNEFATPTNTGDITSWTTTGGAFPGSDQQQAALTFSKGYVYAAGGQATGGGILSEIVIAKINADGTLGSWSLSTSTLNANRRSTSAIVYNDNLYVVGGDSAPIVVTPATNVWYHSVRNGGGGNTGAWTNYTSTASAAAAQATTSYNGYIYSLGGCSAIASTVNSCAGGSNIQTTFTYAAVDAYGVVGSWSTPVSLPSSLGRFGLSATAYNGYLYISGGCSSIGVGTGTCNGFQNDVYYAQINSNGSIGSWVSGGTFTTGRFGHSMVVNNGYLYVLGGCSAMSSDACTAFQSDVQYSQIGANGIPGSWSSAGSSFATGRFYQSAVVNNNNLYVLGGCSAASTINCTTVQSDIQRSAISTSNGLLTGGWTIAGATPKPRYGMSTNAYNGYLYITGGCAANSGGSCSSLFKDIEYIPLTASGLGHRWVKSATDFNNDRMLHNTEVVNGYLVMVGGNASGTFQAQARTSPVSVIDRVGQYSKLLSVSPTTDIAGVYYSGSLDGGSVAQYKVAPSSGVFGAATSATRGTGSEPTPLCGVGSIFYVHLTMTIGDRTNAVYGDDSVSSVTDITVYYRINATPPTNLRLTGGKWFYSETQQPLDLCKQ